MINRSTNVVILNYDFFFHNIHSDVEGIDANRMVFSRQKRGVKEYWFLANYIRFFGVIIKQGTLLACPGYFRKYFFLFTPENLSAFDF